MKIISISGLDGSGKSTQVKLIMNYLESKGKKVFYFHVIKFSIVKKILDLKKHCVICRLLGKCKIENKREEEKSVTDSGWLGIQMRKFLLRVDIARFGKFIKHLKKENYDYIVTDRYFWDSIVNISYLSGNVKLLHNNNKILQPDLSIYLKVDPDEIMKRERTPDQGKIYLQKKKKIYDYFSEKNKLVEIDGNRNRNEIFTDILKKITNL